MYTISVINQKGGVGKTSTAIALGSGLSLKGYKVLYIDIDPQGNLSYTLKADTSQYNALRILQRPETAKDEIQVTEEGHIIASSPSLTGVDATLQEAGREYLLKEALHTLQDVYDFVVIDTPPALGILTINALTASDGIVIPAQADVYSIQGIGQLSQTIQAVKDRTNSSLKILGVLITRYNARTILSQRITEMLEDTASKLDTKLFDSRIREAVAVRESQAVQENIFSYDAKANVTEDFQQFVDEVLQRIEE